MTLPRPARIKNHRDRVDGRTLPLALVFAATLVFACSIAWRFREQALLEANEFRQTQTALTAYWLGQDGFRLAYETPVAGAPWSTPYEFPIYQWVAVKAHQRLGLPLDAAGRLVSFAFLLACLWPAFLLCRQLSLPRGCGWVFGTLLLSSPLHLFVGRSFLIETAALFFSFAFVPFAVRLMQNPGGVASASLGGGFIALGILQKATTGLPVLGVLALCWLSVHWRRLARPLANARVALNAGLCFAVPLAVSAAWTRYADDVRRLNPLGRDPEPGSLAAWIFGELHDHYSPTVMYELFWNRMLAGNVAGILGAAVLAGLLGFGRDRRAVRYAALGAVLAVVPILVFTRVHYYHEYYQTSCLLFLLGAVSIAAASLAGATRAPMVVLTAFAVAASAWNLSVFARKYRPVVERTFSAADHATLAIAEVLKSNIPRGGAFVAFGYDWSSELSYYSERKSFTVPWFYRGYRRVWERPEEYLGGLPLGAIVVGLAPDAPRLDIDDRLRQLPGFSRQRIFWCDVLVRDHSKESPPPAR